MKKALFGIVVFLVAAHAQALRCTLNRENPQVKWQFDQPVFMAREVLKDGKSQETLIVKSNGEVIDGMGAIGSPQELEGALAAFVSKNSDGSYVIGLGKFDASRLDNLLQTTAMAVADAQKTIGVFDPGQKLFFVCIQY